MISQTASPRVALVTGGSRGIGRAIVEALLMESWKVHLCGVSADSVKRTVHELEAIHPGDVHGQVADVRRQEEVDRWVADVVAAEERLDCLVNNAGIGYFAPVDEIEGDDWRRVLGTNLDGAFYGIHAVAPIMKQQGDGWILNVVSIAGRNTFAGGAAYSASKAGMLALSDSAMLDLRHHGIRVAAILPGSVATDFNLPSGTHSKADWKLTPQDVARAVVDLLRYPDRALPSRLELRPSQPPRG